VTYNHNNHIYSLSGDAACVITFRRILCASFLKWAFFWELVVNWVQRADHLSLYKLQPSALVEDGTQPAEINPMNFSRSNLNHLLHSQRAKPNLRIPADPPTPPAALASGKTKPAFWFLPPFRFRCVGGCWNWNLGLLQSWHWSQTLYEFRKKAFQNKSFSSWFNPFFLLSRARQLPCLIFTRTGRMLLRRGTRRSSS
jgi:hypothetical protein